MNVIDYAHSNGWDKDVRIPGYEERKRIVPINPKKIDTTLRRNSRRCHETMQKYQINTRLDFVKWMSKTFDPENNHHVMLAPEMASCLFMQR